MWSSLSGPSSACRTLVSHCDLGLVVSAASKVALTVTLGESVTTNIKHLRLLIMPCSDPNANQGKVKWIFLEKQGFLFESSVDAH